MPRIKKFLQAISEESLRTHTQTDTHTHIRDRFQDQEEEASGGHVTAIQPYKNGFSFHSAMKY